MPYDLKTTCPFARWREISGARVEFGAEGLEPCAVVTGDHGVFYGRLYRVECVVADRIFSSRHDTRTDAIGQARHWLKYVNCPGQI